MWDDGRVVLPYPRVLVNESTLMEVSVSNLQDENWISVGQYDPKTKDVTITRDPVFPGGTTIPIVGDGRPTYKIAAFFPKHNDLGSLAELGREWESAFKVAVSKVNANPNFKVAFSYILVDGGPSTDTCVKAAKVCWSVCRPVCLSVCLSTCLSVCMFVCLSVCLSTCLYI